MDLISSFRREFGLILVGAFIFTASFLWKDVLSEIEELYFPKDDGMFGRILYTIVVTIILVFVAVHIKWIFGLSDRDTARISTESIPVEESEHDDTYNEYSEHVNMSRKLGTNIISDSIEHDNEIHPSGYYADHIDYAELQNNE